jgi:transposase
MFRRNATNGPSGPTGELQERRLEHREEAKKFYRDLKARGTRVRVGMEASGHARWFERLLSELQFELWIGDAAEIRTKRVRKQKTDRQDAQLILRLLMEDRFPRIWVPSWDLPSRSRFLKSITPRTITADSKLSLPRKCHLAAKKKARM